MTFLLAMSEQQKADLSKALKIFWKGMLAVVLVVAIIMAATYLMQYIAKKAEERRAERERAAAENNSADNSAEGNPPQGN